jgi:hypothetical protein
MIESKKNEREKNENKILKIIANENYRQLCVGLSQNPLAILNLQG